MIHQREGLKGGNISPGQADAKTDKLSKRSTPLPYLPGLDGLRAIAVLVVLLYHAEISWFQGGFLGVEVFFVISGYLITTLLLGEWQKTGHLNLNAFWLRRARRLLPALFLLLIVTLVFAVLFLPNEVAGLRSDVLAAFTYVTNWYLIFDHKSYFETVGRPSLLKHLWSLAVEEQFYLLWPPLLALGLAFLRRQRLFLTVIGGAVFSTLLMALLYQPDIDPSRVYYGTDTRAAGLLIGAALAFVWVPGKLQGYAGRFTSRTVDIAGFAGLAVLFWFFTGVGEYDPFLYRGGFALLSLTTVVVIAAVVHSRSLYFARLLGHQPLRWMGLRSYSIYLWHWPVFTVTRPQLDLPLDGLPLFLLRFGLTCLLAELSYRYVETPIRQGALERIWKKFRSPGGFQPTRLWMGTAALVAVCTFALGIAVVTAKPPAPPSYLAIGSIQGVVSGTSPAPTATLATTAAPTASPTPTLAPATTAAQTAKAEATPTPVPTPLPTATPLPPPTPTPKPVVHRVFAMGDSVMIGAAGEMGKVINDLEVDAVRSRYFPEGIDVVRKKRDAGELGQIVIIHLGTNGGFTSKHFDEMMQVLGNTRKVFFVNIKADRQWESNNNQVLANGVKRYPNAFLIDWHSAGGSHPELFWDDGIHLRPEGAKFYANLLASRLK